MDEQLQLVATCTSSKAEDLEAMYASSREVQLSTVTKHIRLSELEQIFGYGPWLRMKNDYHVRYYRGKWKGRPCYNIVHSEIDHIFQ